jgi:hypothetical protein
MNRPTVFIGSSSEHVQTAEALKAGLRPYADATVWNEAAAFELNDSIFGGLLRAADQFDFAVFVFDADDEALIRRSRVRVVRDNVLFEFGLFTGRIGRGRTFRLNAKGTPDTHIPVDLAGIVHLTFSKPRNGGSAALQRALDAACERLGTEFEKQGRRTDRTVEDLDITQLRILCARTSQYSEPKFQEDIEKIKRNFSKSKIESAGDVSAEWLLDNLSHEHKWDIIHLAMYVDPENGDLLVPSGTTSSGNAANGRFPRDGVADMITRTDARLVVIVTCDSLALGARLARATNVIAGYRPIDVRSALDWSAVFYRFLAQGCPLSEAFNRAQTYTDPGLLLLAKHDFKLTT